MNEIIRNGKFEVSVRELFEKAFPYFSNSHKSLDSMMNIAKDYLMTQFREKTSLYTGVRIDSYGVSEDYFYITYIRNETKAEKEKRAANEERQRLQKLASEERKEQEERNKLLAKYKHYLELKYFFDNTDMSFLG